MRRTLMSVQFGWMTLLVLPALSLAQSDRIIGQGVTDECLVDADQRVAGWKAQGRTPAEIEKFFQARLTMCSGLDPAKSLFAGAVNVDYTRFAQLVASDKISPNLYVALIRDRSRKLRGAKASSSWNTAYVMGDRDGDLIPDDRDQCPGTPDLTPTNDQGCPQDTRLPEAPSARDLHAAMNGLGIVTSPVCDGASFPGLSVPIKTGYDNVDRHTFAIAASRVTGQPANCIVLYEVQIRMSKPTSAAVPATDAVQVVFRNTESTDPPASERQVFRMQTTDTGSRKRLYDNAKYYNQLDIRVRAINGNGLSSGWSPVLQRLDPSFGEP
jgi:hypothetical protein